MADVKNVSDATFEAEVLKAPGPVLVDFWAEWCGPCHMVSPVLERVAEAYAGRVTVAKLNIDENPQTTMKYGVRSIPMVALFEGGEQVDGLVGAAPQQYYTQMLEKHLAAA